MIEQASISLLPFVFSTTFKIAFFKEVVSIRVRYGDILRG